MFEWEAFDSFQEGASLCDTWALFFFSLGCADVHFCLLSSAFFKPFKRKQSFLEASSNVVVPYQCLG